MKLTLISILLCALLVAALPRDTDSVFREKCSNNRLSCCSNLKSTAEANGNTVAQDIQGGSIISVLSQDISNSLSQVSNIIPISILSGCAPIIGSSQITCVNYIACCIPRDDRDGPHPRGNSKYDDENKCQVLKDTRSTRQPGLFGLR